ENEFVTIDAATADDLTGLSNRRGFEAIAEHSLEIHRGDAKWVFLLLFELTDLKRLRDEWGRAEGHGAVCDFARTLLEMFQDVDVIARVADDQFAVLGSGSNEDCVDRPLRVFADAMEAVNSSAGPRRQITYETVNVTRRGASRRPVADWLAEAEQRLQRLKSEGF
ncbi:MAG: GGDEF domain-containing protein, partial [Planctomycetota bacterium]